MKKNCCENIIETETAPDRSLPSVMTVKELAEYLRVSPGVIYRLHRRKMIPGGQRIGRIIRFDTQTILDWIKMGERVPWYPQSLMSSRRRGR